MQTKPRIAPIIFNSLSIQGKKIALLAVQQMPDTEILQTQNELEWMIYRDGDRIGGFCHEETWFRTEVSNYTTDPRHPVPIDFVTRQEVRRVLNWAIASLSA